MIDDKKWYDKLDPSRMIAEVARRVRERIFEDIMDEYMDVDKANQVYDRYLKPVRFTFAVCPRCEGRGGYVDPQIDGNGLTSEDLSDDDFRSAYFAGAYDITCAECDGANVVPVTDDKVILEAFNGLLQDDAKYEAYRAAERRFGC
jgi:hypothetical protein